jgi:hypothetical protein
MTKIAGRTLKIIKQNYLILILLVLDFSILLLHIFFGYNKYGFFNLDSERNLPTLYQGLKILIFGYLFFFIWLSMAKTLNRLGNLFAISVFSLFLYLGYDEVNQIHEGVPAYIERFLPNFHENVLKFTDSISYNGAIWIIYYIPIIILVGLPIMSFQIYYLIKKIKWKTLVGFVGIIFLFSIPLIEFLNTSSTLSGDEYNLWVSLEETVEMTSVSLLAYTYYFVFEKLAEEKLQTTNRLEK